jgi:hypothetical protein
VVRSPDIAVDQARANNILVALETTEANLVKLERVWSSLRGLIPEGMAFGAPAKYDDHLREYSALIAAMPSVDGHRLENSTMDYNAIGQARLDAREADELEMHVHVEEMIDKPERDIAEYKFRLRKKRRHLVRIIARELVSEFETELIALTARRPVGSRDNQSISDEELSRLRTIVSQLDRVLGSLASRPGRWGDLRRHLAFGQWSDISDIVKLDWPAIGPAILTSLYGENDPLPVLVADLDSLEELPHDAPVPTALKFSVLRADDFERLLFALVSGEIGYENPQWLMRTNAPDRGRDVSVDRVIADPLGGTRRERVIIQCKHWQETSVGVSELSLLKEQVKLWEPPRVGVLVIATTGRFTADAVRSIEKHNDDGAAPRIEMWPDSHLELLLSRRPAIIGDFGLRPSL